MKAGKGGPAWWRAFGWRRRQGGSIDFADMGTVFGLEASLGASGDAPPPDKAAPPESTEARQRRATDRLNGRSVR